MSKNSRRKKRGARDRLKRALAPENNRSPAEVEFHQVSQDVRMLSQMRSLPFVAFIDRFGAVGIITAEDLHPGDTLMGMLHDFPPSGSTWDKLKSEILNEIVKGKVGAE